MTLGTFTFGSEPYAYSSFSDEFSDDEFLAFVNDSNAALRFLVDVNSVQVTGEVTVVPYVPAFAEYAFGELPNDSATIGSRRFFFGDGKWIGTPTDAVRPNIAARSRISQSADVQRVVPVAPESSRRSEIIIGEIVLANPDGGLDDMMYEYSIAGRPVRIYIGRPTWNFSQFKQLAEMFGQYVEADQESLRIRVQSAESYLNIPLQPSAYMGNGGVDGDGGLAGRLKPICLGECFNITPVLLNADQWIYQVNDGTVDAVSAVRDQGLELTYSGDDVTTYAALRSLNVAAGYYATAKLLGLVKVGLGVAGPEGQITMDVRGEATGGYVASIGEILLRITLSRAKLPSYFLDLQSYFDIIDGPVGFYADGEQDIKVSDVYDALLRPIGGWYGNTSTRLLKLGKLRAPELSTPNFVISSDLLDIEELPLDPPPRYEQSLFYKKNWTQMSAQDISPAVASDFALELQQPGRTYKRQAAEVQIRVLTSISGEIFDSYFADETDARAAVDNMLTMFRVTRRMFRVLLNKNGLKIENDMIVNLKFSRYGLQNGKNFLVVSTRIDGRLGHVELLLWG